MSSIAERPRVSLIAAMGRSRVIGAQNRLPWHLPEDLQYFRRITQGHPIVMGRKTYESIGRLLPGRENRIVSRQPGLVVVGAEVFGTLEEACRKPVKSEGEAELFVIGGAEIYSQALAFADRLYLTLIDEDFEGDAFFPLWDEEIFHEISRQNQVAAAPHLGESLKFSFVVLEKKFAG